MELVNDCSELLCNREVLDTLKNYTSKKQTNLATILYETTAYLDSSPAASSSIANVARFLDTLKNKQYELSKIEKVQLLNLQPQNETELHLIIYNIEERFTEEQRVELLNLLQTLSKEDTSQEARKRLKVE